MAEVELAEQVQRLLAEAQPMPIVTAGHPALRAVAAKVDGQLDEGLLAALIAAMKECMRAAPGVGLAAPQLGLGLALAVVEDPGLDDTDADARAIATVRERAAWPFRVLINPSYTPVGEELVAFYEGCLSIPGYQAVRARPRVIEASYCDQFGVMYRETLRGWPARIFQHETDHLHGELYLDRAEMRSLSTVNYPWGVPADPGVAASVLDFKIP